MRLWRVTGILASLIWPTVVMAQIPVTDVGNLFVNTISSVQNTISAVESVLHTAHWVMEQTPFDEAVQAGDLAQDAAEIEALIAEAQMLGYDIASVSAQINALFGLDGAPGTSMELSIRMAEIRGHVYRARSYAVQPQLLIQSTIRMVKRTISLYNRVMDIVGNLSGQQQLSEHLTQLVMLQTQENVATMASNLAEHIDQLQQPMIAESVRRINERRMADHPR